MNLAHLCRSNPIAGWLLTALVISSCISVSGCTVGGYMWGLHTDEAEGRSVSSEECARLRARLPLPVELVRVDGTKLRGELIRANCFSDSSVVVVARLPRWGSLESKATLDTVTVAASEIRIMTTPREVYRYVGLVSGIAADIALVNFARGFNFGAPPN